MVEFRLPQTAEEANKEAAELVNQGLEKIKDLPKSEARRQIAELMAFVVEKIGQMEDSPLARAVVGTCVLMQGFAVTGSEEELAMFVIALQKYAYSRLMLSQLAEGGDVGCGECDVCKPEGS